MEAPLRPVVPAASSLRSDPRHGQRQRRGSGRSFADELGQGSAETRADQVAPRARPPATARDEEEPLPTIDVVG